MIGMLGNENGGNYENSDSVFLNLDINCLSCFCSSETEWDFVYQSHAPPHKVACWLAFEMRPCGIRKSSFSNGVFSVWM